MLLRYKHIITTISIFLLGIIVQAAGLKVKGRFEVKEGELSGSIVTVERNGQNVKSFQPSKGKNDLGLEFGYNYTISFSKPGYVSKSIVFMTSVPNDVIDKGSFQYDFTLEIFKQIDGVNTMVYNQPVAKIYYSRESDNFVDDKNYSATIQAQMAKVDAEIEKKKSEPTAVVNKTSEVSKNNSSTTTTVATTNSTTQTTTQTNTNTENNKKEETKNNTSVKRNETKSDEDDKAKIEAQQRKMLQEREENRRRTQKLAEEEATREKQQTQIDLEKQKKAFRAEREAEEKKEREERMLADKKRKEDFAKAKEEKLKQEKIAQEEEKKRKAAMDKGPFVRKEEHIDDDQKKTTIITYSRKNETIVYRKIVYKWGAAYYFKDELPITDLIYKDETSKK